MSPLGAKRWMFRLSLLVLALSVVFMWWSFGLLRVQRGMDTMVDTHPPGSLCLIQKRPSEVVDGAVVFLDLQDGSTVLTRVVGVFDDGSVAIRHDNRASSFVWIEARGPYPVAAVRGVVITAFVSEPQGAPALGH